MWVSIPVNGGFGFPDWQRRVREDSVARLCNFKDVRFYSILNFGLFLGHLLEDVRVLPHPKFWPFLGRPLKDVRFYPTLNLCHFWATSQVTLLTSN